MSRPIDPRLLRAAPRARRLLLALSMLTVVGAVLTIAQAVLLAEVIGGLFGGRGGLAKDVLGIGLLALARAGLAAIQEWLTARASIGLRADLRRQVLDSIVRLGPSWISRQQPGRLATAAGPGLDSIDGYVTRALPALVSACIVPPLVLLRIGWADVQSAAILLIVIPLVPIFMILVGMMTRRRTDEQYAALAAMAGQFLDLVQGLTSLRIYGQAQRQLATVRRATDAYRVKTMSTLRLAFLSGLVMDLIATLGIAVVAVDVGLRLDAARLNLTEALVVLLLAPELFGPLRAVGAQFHASEQGRAASGAVLDILDEDVAEPGGNTEHAAGDSRSTGRVSLEHVGASYPGRDAAALSDVSLEVEPGEVVVLQGPSGAGKSTLLSAILGFAHTSGEITISTVEGPSRQAAADQPAWRANLAWVPQRPCPTQRTVGEEIALGAAGASAEDVARAARRCATPDPATVLGEDGSWISAGQRRRVALARALLRAETLRSCGATPIVLLDEPSEDLDEQTEQVVIGVIGDLAGWATVLIASHSEAIAAAADRRILLRAGRVERIVAQLARRTTAGICLPSHTTDAATSTRHELATSPEQPHTDLAGRAVPDERTAAALAPRVTRKLVVAAAFSGAAGLAGVALTATSIWLICRAASHPNVQALALAVVGVRTFALSRALLRYGDRVTSHDAALSMLTRVRAAVFGALIPLSPVQASTSLSAGGDVRRGDLLRRFVNDVDEVQEGVVRAVIPTAGALITAAGATVLALALSPIAGALLAIGLCAAIALAPVIARAAAGSGRQVAAVSGAREARITAALDGASELIAYGSAGREIAKVSQADDAVRALTRRSAAGAAAGVALSGAASGATLCAVLAVGLRGSLEPIALAVLVACVLSSFDAVTPLPAAFAAWGRFAAAHARVQALLGQSPAMPQGHDVPETGAPLGLRARGITLSAAPGARALLRDASLDLAPGARVAVMGPSGCGKSTLLTAALRLRRVDAGSLALVGAGSSMELAHISEPAFPPVVAGSLQGDHVFHASLRDNLRVVRPSATDDELDVVARRAGLASFIRELPQGWSTPAGADGAQLSGGQRQRMLLARAFLADPEILVLDEPTAHLDTATEREILADLLAATRGRTVLISTHRHIPDDELDATVRFADGALREVRRPASREPAAEAMHRGLKTLSAAPSRP